MGRGVVNGAEQKTRKGREKICGGDVREVTRAEKKCDRKGISLLEGLLKLFGHIFRERELFENCWPVRDIRCNEI